MDFKFTKKDKLKSKKQIEHLFENGQSIMAYPLLLKYMETEQIIGLFLYAVPAFITGIIAYYFFKEHKVIFDFDQFII